MRRLPIFLVVDVSESMAGEPLERMQAAIISIVDNLRQDPHALETVYLSVIAFAGRAGTIVPMIELMDFYPPQMPLGSGTALGNALEEVMVQINVNVKRTKADAKGDWEPVVYLITDGRPTDDPRPAITRWRRDFASCASLIAITIGDGADVACLERLTSDIIALDGEAARDLSQFARWVTASIKAHSQSLNLGMGIPAISLHKGEPGISLAKPSDTRPRDDRVVVLTGRCQTSRRPYLMKYVSVPGSGGAYALDGAYPLTEAYFDWSSDSVGDNVQVNTSVLRGVPACPHCHAATAFASCGCGKLMCTYGPGPFVCPWCQQTGHFGEGVGENFDVTRGQG